MEAHASADNVVEQAFRPAFETTMYPCHPGSLGLQPAKDPEDVSSRRTVRMDSQNNADRSGSRPRALSVAPEGAQIIFAAYPGLTPGARLFRPRRGLNLPRCEAALLARRKGSLGRGSRVRDGKGGSVSQGRRMLILLPAALNPTLCVAKSAPQRMGHPQSFGCANGWATRHHHP